MESLESVFGPNSALVEELFEQFKQNPESVPAYWRNYFEELDGGGDNGQHSFNGSASTASSTTTSTTNGATTSTNEAGPETPVTEKPTPKQQTETKKDASAASAPIDQNPNATQIKGVAAKIAENMDASLTVPTATSLRVIPVKMLAEDRDIINRQLVRRMEPKASFTHFIAWAAIRALQTFPSLNHGYELQDGKPYRIDPGQVNLGIAIDLPGKDGSRNLVVPNIKGVDRMNFKEFLYAYAELIAKARAGKLEISDYQGTTISVTNPGTLGTVSSVPRLMQGQGAILATGAIDYPAEFQSMSPEQLHQLGVSKVMTMTCTYDHRIIQGAESGLFLQKINALLNGHEDFYDSIFADLEIPYEPMPPGADTFSAFTNGAADEFEHDRRAIAVWRLMYMYRMRGHGHAEIDPLRQRKDRSPELDLEYYGLTIWDLDREFYCEGLAKKEKSPLRDIIRLLRDTYCGYIGAEYMHILDLQERRWLRERMESTGNYTELTKDQKREILHKLNQAMAFEQFLHKKYIGHKRFSIEGAETLIPMMHFLVEQAAGEDVEKAYIGMAHRGRLNMLVNVIHKPYDQIFSQFEGNIDPGTIQGSGDVKYHIGMKGSHTTAEEHTIELELLSNPSHLEAVNPVVAGAVRAHQDTMDSVDATRKVLPILLHGDAAFAGQGVVAETLNMSLLKGYEVGGTIHVIINNQIGFTTLPVDGRSTQYASDLAKMILAPIFHVNADQPEDAIHVMKMAFDYRQKFGKDVIIDLVGYRKHGHNEGDEPAFTQPGMYKEIDTHPPVRDLYMKKLLASGEFEKGELDALIEEFESLLQSAFEEAKKAQNVEVTQDHFDRTESAQAEREAVPDTRVEKDRLLHIALKMNTVPSDFDANPKLLRQLAKRYELAQSGERKLDWGFAEALAFGSLLMNGTPVRLAGQDAERGTFAHRHAILHGTDTDQQFIPLNHLAEEQGRFTPYNSFLSEFAALGFEFGYSANRDESLVIWEAQFGDFANGAQIVIDQFISASEAKWGQNSRVVMTLPHGYEGQGPEHSSARLERYLQLCAEDNMQVMNLTSPAQYFHALRKQVLQAAAKPMVIMSPKSLLRHPLAVASLDELAEGAFQPVLADPGFVEGGQHAAKSSAVERVVFCTGKVYYDLIQARQEMGAEDNIAIVRVEQLYPFPDQDVKATLEQFSGASSVVWCQEEPQNMGSWGFLAYRFGRLLEGSGRGLSYAGRDAAASPATGQLKIHLAEQKELVETALKR